MNPWKVKISASAKSLLHVVLLTLNCCSTPPTLFNYDLFDFKIMLKKYTVKVQIFYWLLVSKTAYPECWFLASYYIYLYNKETVYSNKQTNNLLIPSKKFIVLTESDFGHKKYIYKCWTSNCDHYIKLLCTF